MTDIIHEYTREQAIADGVLIDVTATAKEAGFQVPVAVTAAVWSRCVAVPEGVTGQDEAWRLWEVLWILRAHLATPRRVLDCLFPVPIQNGEQPPEHVMLKAVMEPDRDWKGVVTIMLPNED